MIYGKFQTVQYFLREEMPTSNKCLESPGVPLSINSMCTIQYQVCVLIIGGMLPTKLN